MEILKRSNDSIIKLESGANITLCNLPINFGGFSILEEPIKVIKYASTKEMLGKSMVQAKETYVTSFQELAWLLFTYESEGSYYKSEDLALHKSDVCNLLVDINKDLTDRRGIKRVLVSGDALSVVEMYMSIAQEYVECKSNANNVKGLNTLSDFIYASVVELPCLVGEFSQTDDDVMEELNHSLRRMASKHFLSSVSKSKIDFVAIQLSTENGLVNITTKSEAVSLICDIAMNGVYSSKDIKYCKTIQRLASFFWIDTDDIKVELNIDDISSGNPYTYVYEPKKSGGYL